MAGAKTSVSVTRALKKFGADLKNARLRRRVSMALLAERAGISEATLARVFKGNPNVSIGSYAMVMFCLGLEKAPFADIADISRDALGRTLDEENLPRRVRKKRPSKDFYDE